MDVKAAIEGVYAAFSYAKRPASVDGCPCCMSAEQYETLTAKPLRDLTSADLDEYASDALLTMGSEDDYQYFLPRILELSLEDGAEWISSIEITGTKMRMAGFEGWTGERRSAINDLWLAVIWEMASTGDDPELLGFISSDIESWLGAATLIPIPVLPLREALEGFPDVVRTLYNHNFKTLFQGQLDNPFLDEPSEGQTEIANWLRLNIERAMN
jgi:hypothetical protein